MTKPFGLARYVVIALAAAGGLSARQARPEAPAPTEYEIKAAFLLRFANYVTWPPEAFAEPETPVTIGILGKDPFGAVLDRAVEGESLGVRRFRILRSLKLDDLKGSHILFVCRSEADRATRILDGLAGFPVLTVSEIPRFAENGGILNFYLDGNKVRFEVNPEAATRVELKISSKLLKLGKIVEDEREKKRR